MLAVEMTADQDPQPGAGPAAGLFDERQGHAVGGHDVVAAVLLVAASGEAGILDASWTAPTTNTDGNALTDLGSYRVYYGTMSSPCPGPTFRQVTSPTTTPGPVETVSYRLTGLVAGTLYRVSVTAVDLNGNESACSPEASAVAAQQATSADFNGDGKADILWRYSSGANYLWLMNGLSVASQGSCPS